MEFAKWHVQDPTIWARVVFSDAKKFNLEGQDGFHYFRKDLRKTPEVSSKHQSGGGGVMVCGAFSCQGKTDLCFLEGKIDLTKYCKVLEDYLLPIIVCLIIGCSSRIILHYMFLMQLVIG